MPNRFFVTGTDTSVGKTVVSATLCAALDAIYWKPIQTGTSEGSDRQSVIALTKIPRDRTLPEIYKFVPPVSPHLAAQKAGVKIDLRKFALPRIPSVDNLIVEGAGGVLVPLNDKALMIDLMARLNLPILLVARTALGTINHTLLSLAALRSAKLAVGGVIIVGKKNPENRKAIEDYGGCPVVGWLPALRKLNRNALLGAYRAQFDRRVFEGR
jgi:dethiobiotin synthetase